MKILLSLVIVIPALSAVIAAGESSSVLVPPAYNNNEIQYRYKSGLRGLKSPPPPPPPPPPPAPQTSPAPPPAPSQSCPEEKKKDLFHYEIDVHVSLGAPQNCTFEEEKLIGDRLDASIRKVFKELGERLGNLYDNHLDTTPLNSFRRALLSSLSLPSDGDGGEEESVHQNSNTARTTSNESGSGADDDDNTIMDDNDQQKDTVTRALGQWGGGFVYKGHGRCSVCNNDNEDERRRDLTSDDFLETKRLAEVQLNADSTASLFEEANPENNTTSSVVSSGEFHIVGRPGSDNVIQCLVGTFPVVTYRLIHILDE